MRFRAWDGFRLSSSGMWLTNTTGTIQSPLETIIEQFTGLLDKNGKEIYEGDIVRFPRWVIGVEVPDRFDNGEVRWNEKLFRYDFGDHAPQTEWLEVIGNIHENLELL
jgi:hypothetical protein